MVSGWRNLANVSYLTLFGAVERGKFGLLWSPDELLDAKPCEFALPSYGFY